MKNIFRFARRSSIVVGAVLMMTLVGCDGNDEPAVPGEPELITKLVVDLNRTDAAGSASANAISAEGLANSVSVISTTMNLTIGASYTGVVTLTASDNSSATMEITDEMDYHQFFYDVLPSGLANDVSIEITDEDANGLPLGLRFNLTVTGEAAGAGWIHIRLGHYGTVTKDGTTPADDFDVDFALPIKFLSP